ncbi:MAG: MBL fold metallo-hydrolase RNA specificity domain-containing protein, partial [archaeon]|nr:MBL fold metallo-hydrolase RNA specificity domain-containing protein [archaeon]
QEVMLVIEDFYRKGLLPEAKVYVDGLTKEASAIHTAYPEYLSQNIQRRILTNDSPFTSPLFANATFKERDEILAKGNAIILASSGMLNGGASLDYFHRMAEDEKNALTFTGYQGMGSLGSKIQQGIRTIPITDEKGKTKELQIRMRVESLDGYSGHSDRRQLENYIRNLNPKPKRIIVDHGNKIKTVAFAKFISQKYGISSTAIRNLDTIRLR